MVSCFRQIRTSRSLRIVRKKIRFPKIIDSSTYTVTEDELLWLLHGLKIEEIVHYKKVVSKS